MSPRVPSQWAHHDQTTLKQRCIDVTDAATTLFRRRLTMTCPLGFNTFIFRSSLFNILFVLFLQYISTSSFSHHRCISSTSFVVTGYVSIIRLNTRTMSVHIRLNTRTMFVHIRLNTRTMFVHIRLNTRTMYRLQLNKIKGTLAPVLAKF